MAELESPDPSIAAPMTRAKQLSLVVAALIATPETINPCTRLYYELYLQYTFGNLDIGTLLLHKDGLTATIEAGKESQQTVKDSIQKLRDLPSRSSLYAPL